MQNLCKFYHNVFFLFGSTHFLHQTPHADSVVAERLAPRNIYGENIYVLSVASSFGSVMGSTLISHH